jgi:hypothetical protein
MDDTRLPLKFMKTVGVRLDHGYGGVWGLQVALLRPYLKSAFRGHSCCDRFFDKGLVYIAPILTI